MESNILIIAPHADDEAFGCGGTIARMTSRGYYVHLLVMAMGKHSEEEYETRKYEAQSACAILGIAQMDIIAPYFDSKLDQYGIVRLINFIENIMKRKQYQTVFYPSPSHHQDHKITEMACVAALRPGAQSYNPHTILMYEYTYPTWANVTAPGGKLYVDITKTIDKKELAIRAYESQLREDKHPVSIKAMKALARTRGYDIGVNYAEMFQVVRIIGEI